MGILLSSSPTPSTLAPVYSGVEKLLAIFEGHDDHETSSISPEARWKDVLNILLDTLAESPATDRCFVAAMHIYKETNLIPYHEMLLFELATDMGQKYFMRVDRYVSNPNSNMFSASDSTSTLVASPVADKATPCRAEHQVQIALSDTFVDPSLVKAISASFPPQTASFRRLLDLLKLVASDAYGDYNLWDRSCYWFSSVVYKTYTMEFAPHVEDKGPAHVNLGKFAKHGNGVDWLTAYLDDQGKLFDAWTSTKSALTPVAQFLVKEKGKGKMEYDSERDVFLIRTRIGFSYTVFSAEGVSGDNRPEHIAKGVYTADLNGRLINFTSHGSSLFDVRFKSRDEAQTLFEAMRCLIDQQDFAFYPMDVLVDRRHSSIMIAQQAAGPTFLDCSSRTVSSRPNPKRFRPLEFNLDARHRDITPRITSYRPLQIEWRNSKQSLVWKQEYLPQTGHTSDTTSWSRYWETYFRNPSIHD
ncbi:hypothetical protein HGRIS_005972 [Hohenbuehelia grisea]|uniref:Uncharacterized protein n=1 Tax=Hohenbuehelia grisea TaxID=104357 RepID=A0ABR3JZY0_9AGAR